MENVLERINAFVWGVPSVVLILGTGIYLTWITGFAQFRLFPDALRSFWRNIFPKTQQTQGVSSFQALCTALAATVGTGNIAGVAGAIAIGGPGAVFWMWVSAFFGMVTNYAENVLGLYFRKKDEKGEFSGGPMYYLSEGLGRNTQGKWGCVFKTVGKILGVMAAVFCVFAAIGMSGVQTNKISTTFQSVINGNEQIVGLVVGIVVAKMLHSLIFLTAD